VLFKHSVTFWGFVREHNVEFPYSTCLGEYSRSVSSRVLDLKAAFPSDIVGNLDLMLGFLFHGPVHTSITVGALLAPAIPFSFVSF